LADLLGDDREAAALLAGAGGLDGGVERQQVGLLGDAGDRVDEADDLARALRELADRRRDGGGELAHRAHGLGGVVGGGDALLGHGAGLAGHAGGLVGRRRALAHGLGQVGGEVEGLVDDARLALHALGDLADRVGGLGARAAGLLGGV